MMRTQGLSLIELLIAIGILSLALTAFTSVIVSNLRHNSSAGARSQAALLLDYLGRKATTGDAEVLPQTNQSSRNWNYGALLTSFSDLKKMGGFSDPNRFRAAVENLGAWSDPSNTITLRRYRFMVCWQGSSAEECVKAESIGPQALATGSPPPPLPGIN